MHYLLTLLLGPVLFLQGVRTKKRTPKLPEPHGPRKGVVGNGNELKLLIIGDSAGAGVGVSHQSEALSGQLVKHLSKAYCVDWYLSATTGATTQSTFQSLSELPGQSYDVVITSLGVNDVTSGMSLMKWCKQQIQLRNQLRAQFQVKMIVCTGLPPMRNFPALPQPLRWFLGRRALEFDLNLQQQLAHEPDSHYLHIELPEDEALMASDGFHPGSPVYEEWGKLAALMISSLVSEETNLYE